MSADTFTSIFTFYLFPWNKKSRTQYEYSILCDYGHSTVAQFTIHHGGRETEAKTSRRIRNRAAKEEKKYAETAEALYID